MNTAKHAYLIMAHNNFEILERLIELLDDKRNDIYIHINKRAGWIDYDRFRRRAENSRLYFIKRTNTKWGGYSQIKCILSLLRSATEKGYDYYHYLSGVDLPLKSQDDIHAFFERNTGREFVHFDNKVCRKSYMDRIRYYYFFQDRPNSRLGRLMIKCIHKSMLMVQKVLGVDRLKNNKLQIQKGADWFSITDSLARYILSEEDLIERMFKYTSLGVEMFIQTLVWNSDFKDRLYDKGYNNNYRACMRYIDWKRGKPYVWRLEDYDKLIHSDYLFARKFDYQTDPQIVEKIYRTIMHQEKGKEGDRTNQDDGMMVTEQATI